jgi:hypothetical protein
MGLIHPIGHVEREARKAYANTTRASWGGEEQKKGLHENEKLRRRLAALGLIWDLARTKGLAS